MLPALVSGRGILGEEGGSSGIGHDRQWIIDPIDGTANYMRNLPWWSVSIALFEKGMPFAGIVHAPAMGVTMTVVRGEGVKCNGRALVISPAVNKSAPMVLSGIAPQNVFYVRAEHVSRMIVAELGGTERRLGCGTVSIMQVLLGKADLYVGLGEHIWDIAAVATIAEELGLRHTIDFSKRDVSEEPFDFICGNSLLVDSAREAMWRDGYRLAN